MPWPPDGAIFTSADLRRVRSNGPCLPLPRLEKKLEWDPAIDERRIGFSVIDGVVTLKQKIEESDD